MRQISELTLFIYKRDLKEILLIIISAVVIWVIAGLLSSKKVWLARIWKILNHIVFIIIFIAILYLTIFSRSKIDELEVCLIPFYSFYLAKENSELYRTMLMNIFLFVPLGLSLPNVFAGHKNSVCRAVLLIIVLSVVIELVQFLFQLGRAEIDDVLCNLLGGIIGAGAYIFSKKLLND